MPFLISYYIFLVQCVCLIECGSSSLLLVIMIDGSAALLKSVLFRFTQVFTGFFDLSFSVLHPLLFPFY